MNAAVLAAFGVVAGFGTGLTVGIRLGGRELRGQLAQLHARNDAYRMADTRGDLDVVGPITPPAPMAAVRQSTTTEIGDDLDVDAWVNQAAPVVYEGWRRP